jgi:maltose/moltooligosaccharide transporter
MTPDQAAFSLGFFSLSFLVFAIPSGFLATAIGRKKTILVGVSGISLVIILECVQDRALQILRSPDYSQSYG